MAKPAITKRAVKGSALTYAELDTNFQNLTDATIALTAGTGGTQVISDLNGNITLVAGTGVTLAGDNTAKTITINTAGTGTVNSGVDKRIPFYSGTGTTLDDSALSLQVVSGSLVLKNEDHPSINNGLVIDYGASGTAYSNIDGDATSIVASVGDTSTGKTAYLNLFNGIAYIKGSTSVNLETMNTSFGIGTSGDTVLTCSSSLNLLIRNGASGSSIKVASGANGNIELNPAGTGLVKVLADFDLTTGVIGTSTTDTDIYIEPNGTGKVVTSTDLSVTGSIQINDKQAVNGPAFRAYPATAQTIPSGSLQKVTFGTESYDTNSNFASSTFTPTVEGYYQLNATVRLDGSTGTGECMIVLYKNSSEYARGNNQSGTEQGASFYSMQISDIAYANGSTDSFHIRIQQTSGSNRETTAGSTISYFSGSMIRGA